MRSLAFASQGDCEPHGGEVQQLRRRVNCLEKETEILGKIIRINQATFEEINELVSQELQSAQRIATHELSSQHNRLHNPTANPTLQQQIHLEIATQISQLVTGYQQNFLKVYQGFMEEHRTATSRLKRQLAEEGGKGKHSEGGDCDTSIEEHPSGKAIFQVPIQLQLLKEVSDSDVQVDFTPSKSIYEVPIEMNEVFEVPVELNHIFQVPVELNRCQPAHKYRVFEVPLEMEEVIDIPVELQLLGDEAITQNKIMQRPVFLNHLNENAGIEQQNAKLRLQITQLTEQLIVLKKELSENPKRIYQIPVQLQPLPENDLNSSQCEVYMPQIESQKTLERSQSHPCRYDSVKQSSKISTQINTRPDLELSPLKERSCEEKSSIILSNTTPIQQSLTFVPPSQSSTLKNINFFISQKEISHMEYVDEGNQVTRNFKDVPVEIEIDGETVQIEMQIMQEVETAEHQAQTDPLPPQKANRIAKIPFVKIVQVPYEVEKIVQRRVKLPVLKMVQVPYEVQKVVERFVKLPVLQIVEVPVQPLNDKKSGLAALRLEVNGQQQLKEVKLCNSNEPKAHQCSVVQVPVQMIVEKIIVKEVPIEVIVEKELPPRTIVKEVPIQVQIEKIVEVPKVILKEVPIEVIVEKPVIVQKEVIVERIVQLPPKTIIKELPIEVIVEKEVIAERIVELPARTLIKEVPVEVIVERLVELPGKTIIKEVPVEVIVEVPIIKEVPVEIIIEKIVEIPGRTIIKEVPVELIVEKQKIVVKEVPVEVVVEKLVEVKVIEIRQVPVEVIVQKKVPILKEIPYEVEIVKEVERIVEVQKIIPVIKQVPVEVVVEVEKVIKELVEVPVFIYITPDKQEPLNKDYSAAFLQESDQLLLKKLQAVEYLKSQEPIVNQLLLQSNYPIELQTQHLPQIVEVPVEVVVQKITEVPVELITVRKVPQLIEVPTELMLVEEVEKIVYVPQEKIVYVPQQRIVEVPVQIAIQKPVYIDRIVEVPVEVIVYRDRLIEIPVEIEPRPTQEEQRPSVQLIQVPVEIMLQPLNDQSEPAPVSLNAQQTPFLASQVAQLTAVKSTHHHGHQDYQITYQIPAGMSGEGEQYICNIDTSKFVFGHDRQIIIQIPFENLKPSQSDNQAQTDSFIQNELAGESRSASVIAKLDNMDSQQNYSKNEVGVQTTHTEKLRIVQLPIQVENIDYQQLQREAERKYRDYLIHLKESYGAEIMELTKSINALQSIIMETQAEKDSLKQSIQHQALREQSLLKQMQLLAKEASDANLIQQLQLEILHLKQRIKESQQHSHKIYEVMVEVQTIKETQSQLIQTEPIQLTPPDILQIPIQLQVKQFIEEISLNELQQIEQVNLAAANHQEYAQIECQTDNHHLIMFQAPRQVHLRKPSEEWPVQTDLTFRLLSDQDKSISNNRNIREAPTQLIQPIIIEVPTQVKLLTDTLSVYIQTDFDPATSNHQEIQTEGEQVPDSCPSEEEQPTFSQKDSSVKHRHPLSYRDTSFKKKPNSEYFPSRIIEIPIQLIRQDPTKAVLSTEAQTEPSEIDHLLSNVLPSRQREIVASQLKIVAAFEPVKIIFENATPRRLSPQKRILRFGSDTENLCVNGNFSNVQSLTPNQLDNSSSIDKFPGPAININNISVIKKSSIHSEGKFFGSLDMRDDLLNHQDALASVRMANRKLTGFDEQVDSSSESDIHNLSREMIIQENETIVSRDINRIQTPNLEPHDLNFSEYATLQEKMYLQEEKVNYQELYENTIADLDSLRHKLNNKQEELAHLKLDLDHETTRYEQKLRKASQQLTAAHKLLADQEAALENSKLRVGELEESKIKLQKQIEMLFENWERLKEDSEKNQVASNKEFERLRAIIGEKVAEIRELKTDGHHQKEAFEAQLEEHREAVRSKTLEIEQLQEELQRKNDRIDQLTDNLEQMRKNINSHSEQDTAAIYEQEFQRVKEGFEEEKRELNYMLYELKQQNHELNQALMQERNKRQELEAVIGQLEQEVREAKQEYSSLHHLKSELENNFVEGVKCLNQQLEEMKDLVREKDQIIQHQLPNLHSSLAPSPASPFRIEYLSKQASQLAAEPGRQAEAYSRKLQGLLKKYERVILQNQGTIEQLQEKVYEYLRDALEKQQEAEGLYMKLVDYENTINSILVQKVTLDIENKRLSKQIELSEKKLKVLGNRLIQVARNRAQYDSDEDYYYD